MSQTHLFITASTVFCLAFILVAIHDIAHNGRLLLRPTSSASTTSACDGMQLVPPFQWLPIKDPRVANSAFRMIGGVIYETKNPFNPYAPSTTLVDADPSSFEVWSDWSDDLAKDSSHVYGEGKIIVGANPKSFMLLFTPGNTFGFYAKDGDLVFHHFFDGWGVVPGADPQTFIILPKVDQVPYINNCLFDAADALHLYEGGERAKCR